MQLSTALVARLTHLLELESLEQIKHLEECGYIKQNIEIERDEDFEYSEIYDSIEQPKTSNHITQLFRSLSDKLAGWLLDCFICDGENSPNFLL